MSLIKTYKKVPKLETRTLKHDWTGARRGKLTIRYPIRRDGKHLHWLAECDCGTQVEAIGHQIELSSSLSSCGRCQTMKRITLPELPYTLYDDKIPEQKELPLEEDIPQEKLDEIFDEPTEYLDGDEELEALFNTPEAIAKTNDILAELARRHIPELMKPKEVEAMPLTAWSAAEFCCERLELLDKKERIKAVQLIRVQLGYDL